jgi:hypothetical protein
MQQRQHPQFAAATAVAAAAAASCCSCYVTAQPCGAHQHKLLAQRSRCHNHSRSTAPPGECLHGLFYAASAASVRLTILHC